MHLGQNIMEKILEVSAKYSQKNAFWAKYDGKNAFGAQCNGENLKVLVKIHTQKMHSGLLKNIGNLMIQQHLS